jgi:hypothetical protein
MRKIRIEVKGNQTLPLEKLEPFQGALKHLGKTEYENLRKTLIDFGFSFVVHVWKDNDRYFIIDGHQRVFVLNQMVKIEGWEVPEIPVAIVEAKSFGEAKRKVLAAASQYGTVTEASLSLYLKDNDIQFDEIVANFHFPEVDFSEMADQFAQGIPEVVHDMSEEGEEKTSASGSNQVKQLQLFFRLEDYNEFISKVEALQETYKSDNVSDTLLEIVRERHTHHKGA